MSSPTTTSPEADTLTTPDVSLGVLAIWLGLLAGFAELLTIAIQDTIRLTITVDSIRTNHHHIWMIPISGVMLTGASASFLLLIGRGFPVLVRSIGPYAIAFVACLMPLTAIRGLHPSAQILLAAGLCSRIVPILRRQPNATRALVRYTLPATLATLTLLIGIKGSDVLFAEQRAIAKLPPPAIGNKNVILLVMDNVRADHLSLHGYSRDTSPSLEAIAKRGVRFDHARSPAPWTLPAHASMLTGLWPDQLSTSIDTPLNNVPPTLAETLAAQGYLTGGFVGNTYYCNAWYGLDRGFTRYEDFAENRQINPYEIFRSSKLGDAVLAALGVELASPGEKNSRKTAEEINKSLLSWVDNRGQRPFFAFVNYYDAHEPFSPPEGYARRYGLSKLDETSRRLISKRFRNLSRKISQNPSLPPRTDAEIVDEALRLQIDGYDDCIRYLDGQIGELFAQLDQRHLLENTVVVITSDHGEHFGENGLYGHGNSLYRPVIDVPLIVLSPDLPKPGQVVSEFVSTRDIAATVRLLSGKDHPTDKLLPGESLAELWVEPRHLTSPRTPPFSHAEFQPKLAADTRAPAARGPVWSISDEERIYIRNHNQQEELYDLADDPREEHNLADVAEEKQRRDSMRARLDQILNARTFSRIR